MLRQYCAESEHYETVAGGKKFKQHHIYVSDLGAFDAADDIDEFAQKAALQIHPRIRRMLKEVDGRVSAREEQRPKKNI